MITNYNKFLTISLHWIRPTRLVGGSPISKISHKNAIISLLSFSQFPANNNKTTKQRDAFPPYSSARFQFQQPQKKNHRIVTARESPASSAPRDQNAVHINIRSTGLAPPRPRAAAAAADLRLRIPRQSQRHMSAREEAVRRRPIASDAMRRQQCRAGDVLPAMHRSIRRHGGHMGELDAPRRRQRQQRHRLPGALREQGPVEPVAGRAQQSAGVVGRRSMRE